ncbi:MAG TPA: L-threonylcarbamoyladenylate synthase [Cyclobacteriaceae bacterium]|jgi:L-threonylcarbamoyladenylate synthase|nr:L-threonylcarbamoyladenylate synthase [Cyclobacteriaceae bacterium]
MAEIGKDISKAASILRQGKLVAIPTETVYGLAANALDVNAVTKIFVAKNRPYFDPLIVHVQSADAVKEFAEKIPEWAFELMKRFWPGPLTLLLPRKNIVSDLVTAGLDRVGLRCPDHAMTLELLRSLSFPLAAPSANPFGYVSPTMPQHVNDQLGNAIEYILDGGECKVGVESTIVGFEDSTPVIYRLGGLRVEDIESVTGPAKVMTTSVSNPQAPGQLQSHYAPRKKVLIGDINELLKDYDRVGVLSFQKKYLSGKIGKQIILSPAGNLEETAQKLFSSLRELDKSDVDIILTELVPDIGLGRAINDRLRRAAT